MEDLEIRKFNNDDAKTVSKLICRNFMEVNIKDIPKLRLKMHFRI